VDPIGVAPAIGDGSPHGAYYWDQSSSTVWVKVKGGGRLEVRSENAIMVSPTLALSFDQFYATQATFIKVCAVGVTE
jgi:hypothetical protein